jgi:chemotaxis signal transduction protein
VSDTPLDNEKAKKILAERAARFALEEIELTETKHSKLLVFNLGKEQKYAVDFDVIERVIPQQNVRLVPDTSPLFSGIIYHNAEFWPVINLNTLFNCKQENNEENFILIYDEPYRYAFRIGTFLGQMNYDKSDELTQLSDDDSNAHLLGIYKADVAVVNISTILNLLRNTKIKGH